MEYVTISEFPNYEINKIGEVRNKKTKRIMKPDKNGDGYYKVYLIKEKAKKAKGPYIHRLLAMTFIENPENKTVVDHINGIRTDNDLNNLRWMTMQENNRNRIDYDITIRYCSKLNKWIFQNSNNYSMFNNIDDVVFYYKSII